MPSAASSRRDNVWRCCKNCLPTNPASKSSPTTISPSSRQKKREATAILRGIRSVADFEYEKTIADLNRDISGIETLLLFTEPQYAHISSSVVRELLRFNQPVKQFIPQNLVLPDLR